MLANTAWHDRNGLFIEYVVLLVGISGCALRVVVEIWTFSVVCVETCFIIRGCFGDIIAVFYSVTVLMRD